MSGYTPQVGDRVRDTGWRTTDDQRDLIVTGVGRHNFTAVPVDSDPDDVRKERLVGFGEWWEKVEMPKALPDRWIAVLGSHEIESFYRWSSGHLSRPAAIDYAATVFPESPLLAIVHVWTDEHGTDHAEIERVES